MPANAPARKTIPGKRVPMGSLRKTALTGGVFIW